MPTFSYVARTRGGEKTQGSVEASDKRAALVKLERMGYIPVSVNEGATPAGGAKAKPKAKKRFKLELGKNRAPKMKIREVLIFTRELADLLASGMTLGHALNTLSRRETQTDQDEIIATVRDEIVKGASLSDALQRYPKSFSALYISMVQAGEASGTVSEVLERLCRHYERTQEAREKVLMALVYPSIVMVMGLTTMIFCMIFVVPRFSSIFDELGGSLPLPTQILVTTSEVMLQYGWLVLILVVVGIIAAKNALKTPAGLRWWHGMQLRIPVMNKVVTANAYGHFARTLGALLANGVPVLNALTIVENTVGNSVIAQEIREARDRVTDGATISKPLAEGKIFPPLLTDMLAVGEESGDMSGALGHIGRRYDYELDQSVKLLTTVLEPIMILAMAILVGYIAVSMLMAVFDLTSGLNV